MTSPVTGSTTATGADAATATAKNRSASTGQAELGKDAFLQLLVAQLRYQDPTSPMDTSAFMAQTSQLTTVERLTELSAVTRQSFDLQSQLAATSMVGRLVTYEAADGQSVTDVVDGVSFAGGVTTLTIGEEDVTLSQVSAVTRQAD
jgi:flagellar basal-body rod modification protein FlgD